MSTIYRRVPEGGRGCPRHAVYCAACPACGVPGAGWYYAEGFGTSGREYFCPACGPDLATEDAARAGEPADVPTDAELDVRIDARARAESRAGRLGGGGR